MLGEQTSLATLLRDSLCSQSWSSSVNSFESLSRRLTSSAVAMGRPPFHDRGSLKRRPSASSGADCSSWSSSGSSGAGSAALLRRDDMTRGVGEAMTPRGVWWFVVVASTGSCGANRESDALSNSAPPCCRPGKSARRQPGGDGRAMQSRGGSVVVVGVCALIKDLYCMLVVGDYVRPPKKHHCKHPPPPKCLCPLTMETRSLPRKRLESLLAR